METIKKCSFLSIFSVLVIFLTFLPNLEAAKPPFPLVNSIHLDGGICYMNALLQCLFQNDQFCTNLDTVQGALGPTWNEVWKVWNQDPSLRSVSRGITRAWTLHEHLRHTAPSLHTPAGKALWMLNQLMTNLTAEASGTLENYLYYEQHRLPQFNKTCHKAEFSFRDEESVYRVPNLYASPYQYDSGLGITAGIMVVPALNLIVVIPRENNPFALSERGYSFFNDIWNQTKHTHISITPHLVGIMMGMETTEHEWHATTYAHHHGTWFLCNDDTMIQPLGSFEIAKAHMANIVTFFNTHFEIFTGTEATIHSAFVSAFPKMLFYEIEEGPELPPIPPSAPRVPTAPRSIPSAQPTLEITTLSDIYKLPQLIPTLQQHEIEALESDILHHQEVDEHMTLTPSGLRRVSDFVQTRSRLVDIERQGQAPRPSASGSVSKPLPPTPPAKLATSLRLTTLDDLDTLTRIGIASWKIEQLKDLLLSTPGTLDPKTLGITPQGASLIQQHLAR